VLGVQGVHLLWPERALLVHQDVQPLVDDQVVDDLLALLEGVGLDDAQRPAAGSQPRCRESGNISGSSCTASVEPSQQRPGKQRSLQLIIVPICARDCAAGSDETKR
jgi:hypothetical protein